MNADGTNQTQLTFLTTSFNSAITPSFNQNGTRIAFESQRGVNNETDIYSINADGTGEIRLTTAIRKDQKPAYSPDGSKIVFVSFRDGDALGGEIYAMNADGSNQTRLTNNNYADSDPTFTPDGSQIMFLNQNGMMIMKADGQNARLVTGGGSHPSFAPQSDSDGDGTGDVCDADFDAFTPTGTNITVRTGDGSVNFSGVSSQGTTSFAPITVAQNALPDGYTLCPSCPAYEITTTAIYTPPITVCLGVSASVSDTIFQQMKLLHGEHGVFVNRTSNRYTDAQGRRFVCGAVDSLSPFVLASSLSPTAAPVSLSGRVFITGKSLNIPSHRVQIFLLDTQTGIERATETNARGFYRFDELEIRRFYIVRAASRNFVFTPDNYFLELYEDRENVNFTGGRLPPRKRRQNN